MTHAAEPHLVPLRLYFGTFLVLLVLTGVTVAAAFQDLGALNTPVALLIAGVKAAFVLLIFMHLRWSEKLNTVAAVAGLLWLALLIVVMLGDVTTRTSSAIPPG